MSSVGSNIIPAELTGMSAVGGFARAMGTAF